MNRRISIVYLLQSSNVQLKLVITWMGTTRSKLQKEVSRRTKRGHQDLATLSQVKHGQNALNQLNYSNQGCNLAQIKASSKRVTLLAVGLGD
jgi:hypothetical protein